jgi:6,7-dimethyl-8-ribityllumazine synthase
MKRTVAASQSAKGLRIGIVLSRFNDFVTQRLYRGAMECLKTHGAVERDVETFSCPGSFEIPQVAHHLAMTRRYDALIGLGCVIRGETPHFEYVAAEAAQGIGEVARSTGVPISFGLLTTDNLEQALERSGGKAGNKGWDAALSAIEMANLIRSIKGKKGRKRRAT